MIGRRPPKQHGRVRIVSLFVVFAVWSLLTSTAAAGPFVDAGYSPASMVDWASAVDEVVRGAVDIAMPGLGLASFGVESNLLGAATGDPSDVVSLGDGGSASLIFFSGIRDGIGDDFAIFENGFLDLSGLFAELAYVEVSTNGVDFARFDSDALNIVPVAPFDTLDPTDYHGLAGRHAGGLGTGFDLADIAFDPLVLAGDVDLDDINFVRVIDVIGDGSTTDGGGNPIYDPYTTPFESGGFDLEGIGVIHVPEPSWGFGLLFGLLALLIAGNGTHSAASTKSAASRFGIAMTFFFATASPAAALTVSFGDLGLAANSFENGAGLSGGFTSNGVFFENNYTAAYDSFTGYAASTMTDATTPGFGNQFSNIAGSGASGSEEYGIAFLVGSIILPSASIVQSAEITNTTYAALSMRDGDSFAKQFGGASGNDEDYFRLLIEGIDSLGMSTGTIELMLADFRFPDNSQDFILDQWVLLNLNGLGIVSELRFSFESSDVGPFGINTPQYFAIDNLVFIPAPEPGTALLMGIGLACLARRPPSTRRSSR